MRKLIYLIPLALVAAQPVAAKDDKPVKPVTVDDPSMGDAAMTPIDDLNIGRDGDIPAILVRAVSHPYDLSGLGKCKALAAEVGQLDAILGPDVDMPLDPADRLSEGRVAKWVVSSFIPFRGLIREITGANAQDRKVRAAIQAGFARRGFLRGVGANRKCAYPASPATPAVIQAKLDAIAADEDKGDKGKRGKDVALADRTR